MREMPRGDQRALAPELPDWGTGMAMGLPADLWTLCGPFGLFGSRGLSGGGVFGRERGGGGWHKASVFGCLPLAAPIGLSPLLILTPCGPERVLVVSTEPPDDLSCLTTPGVGRPGDGAGARAGDRVHPDADSESMRGFADSSTALCALGVCI